MLVAKSDTEPVVFLQGTKLYLRPPEKQDIPYIVRWLNDPEVGEYILGRMYPITEQEREAWLERLATKKTDICLVIVERKSNRPIGFTGIYEINWRDRRAETGTVIGERSFWDKNFGTEAKMLALKYAFSTLNLRKLTSKVIAGNTRVIRVNRKCGYYIEGTLRKHIFKDGEYVDVLEMAVFRGKWLRSKIWKKLLR